MHPSLPHSTCDVRPDVLADAQILGRIDPPEDFGVAWIHQGEHKRYGHVMDIWVAVATSDAYRVAWKREREALGVAGYSWTDKSRSDDMPFAMPCWWERRDVPLDRATLRTAVERALAAEDERAASQDAERIRRDAEVDERIGARVTVIRARLAALLAASAWQLGKGASAAAEHLELARWAEWDLGWAERMRPTPPATPAGPRAGSAARTRCGSSARPIR